jgi:hypothetical protein
MFQWTTNDGLNKAVDTLTKAAQVIALLVAGWWTYRVFRLSIFPTLEIRDSGDANINWSKSSDPSDCEGSLDISLSNDGVSPFDVSEMTVTGWLYTSDKKLAGPKDISVPKPTVSSPVSVEIDQIRGNEHFYQQTFDSTSTSTLVAHYPPGNKSHDSLIWHFRKAKGQGVLYLVEYKITNSDSNTVAKAWVTDDVCNLLLEATDASKKQIVK